MLYGNSSKAIRHFRLLLSTIFYLDLKYIFVVPSFSRNLALVSYLDKSDCFCSFGKYVFNLSLNSNIFRNDSLLTYNNLYLLDTTVNYSESSNVESCDTKHKIDKLTQKHYDAST